MSGERGGHLPSDIKRSSKKHLSSSYDFFDTCSCALSCWNQQRQVFLLRYASERFGRVNRQHLSPSVQQVTVLFCFAHGEGCTPSHAFETCLPDMLHVYDAHLFINNNLTFPLDFKYSSTMKTHWDIVKTIFRLWCYVSRSKLNRLS